MKSKTEKESYGHYDDWDNEYYRKQYEGTYAKDVMGIVMK